MSDYIIKTKRLGLRLWKDEDYIPFAEMCADPKVMRFFPSTLSADESIRLIRRFEERYKQDGFTYFAIDILKTINTPSHFIGFTGLLMQTYESPFTPNVDIGWRLTRAAWGKGYATEAAQACLIYASNTFKIKTIISVATATNAPSINVMKKIGMQYIGKFDHPNLLKYPNLNPCFVHQWGGSKKL